MKNRDLRIAASEIEKMKSTRSFEDFRESWENFLMRLEKVWEVTERKYKKDQSFQNWASPYRKLRKKDPLLIFLKQARNAEMHSISSSVEKPLKILVKDTSGRGFALDSVSTKLEKGVFTISIETRDGFAEGKAELVPTGPEVVRIKNRDKWYNPPWSHLKNRIDDLHPVYLAELGLAFYTAFVKELDRKYDGSI